MRMTGYNYKINYNGSSKVIKRIVDKLNHWAEAMLGTTHDTAYYGDLGQIAYEHSQTTGNPHNLTLDDLGLQDVPREIAMIMEAIDGGSDDQWVDHDENQFVDHDGNELVFHADAQLLGWH